MPNYGLFNLSNSTEIPRFVGSAVPELSAAAQALQNRYDTAQQYEDALDQGIQQSVSTSADATMLQELKDKYRGKIGEFAKRGDYENLVKETRRAARDFINEYKPLAQNVQLQQEYRKMLDEQQQKGDIDPETAGKAWDYSVRQYKGLQRDPKTGQLVNQFRGMPVVKNINLPEWVDKALVGITDQKTGSTIRKDEGGYYVLRGNEREYLGWDRIKPVLDAAKASDPNFQAWANQRALLGSYQADSVPEDAIRASNLYPQLQQLASQKGISLNQALKEMYAQREMQNIDQSILAFGSKYLKDNRKTTYKVEGETEATTRAAADKAQNVFAGMVTMALPGTTYDTPGKLTTAKKDMDVAMNQAVNNYSEFMSGLTQDSKGIWRDKDGNDKSFLVTKNQEAIRQMEQRKKDIEAYDKKIREQVGFVITPALERDAKKAYDDVMTTTKYDHMFQKDRGGNLTPEGQAAKERLARGKYETTLNQGHPRYPAYKKALEENAQKGSVEVPVQRFTTKSANEAMETMVTNLAQDLDVKGLKGGALGLRNMDGSELTDEDYKDIKGDTKFAGWFVDPADGNYKLVLKVGKVNVSSKGESVGTTRLVKMDAGQDVVNHILKTGQMDEARRFVGQSISALEQTPTKQTVFRFPDGSGAVQVQRMNSVDKRDPQMVKEFGNGVPNYKVTFNMPDGQKTFVFEDFTDVVETIVGNMNGTKKK